MRAFDGIMSKQFFTAQIQHNFEAFDFIPTFTRINVDPKATSFRSLRNRTNFWLQMYLNSEVFDFVPTFARSILFANLPFLLFVIILTGWLPNKPETTRKELHLLLGRHLLTNKKVCYQTSRKRSFGDLRILFWSTSQTRKFLLECLSSKLQVCTKCCPLGPRNTVK